MFILICNWLNAHFTQFVVYSSYPTHFFVRIFYVINCASVKILHVATYLAASLIYEFIIHFVPVPGDPYPVESGIPPAPAPAPSIRNNTGMT